MMQEVQAKIDVTAPAARGRKARKDGGLADRGLGDLQGLVAALSRNGDLVRVRTEVDPVFELAGVAARFEGGKAVLFEKVKGHAVPILTGLYWNRDLLARLFECPTPRLPFLLADAVAAWQRNPVDPVVVDRGPANEVIEKQPTLLEYIQNRIASSDGAVKPASAPGPTLYSLPAPIHALQDGGRYLDSSVVIARDPDTGVRNANISRMLVTGPNRMTMLMDAGRHLRDYYERAERQGRPLEITINNGVDLATHMAAIVPAGAAPIDRDELGIASTLLGEPLKLLRSQVVGVEGIASAQYIIEAEILPQVREPEGPFAEVTGYYATLADRWVVNVKALTRRKQPIFHTILSGKEVFNAVGLTGEASIFRSVSGQVPGVTAVYLPHGGCGFYHAVVQIQKRLEGMGKNAIMATFAAFPPLNQVVVVDDDVDLYNAEDVEWAIATRFRPEVDLVLVPQARGHELNPSTDGGICTKVGIDATAPVPRDERFERVKMMDVDLSRYDIVG